MPHPHSTPPIHISQTSQNRTEQDRTQQLRSAQDRTHTHLLVCKPKVPQQVSRHHGVVVQIRDAGDVLHRLDEGSPIDMAPAVRDEEADPATRPCVVYGMVEGTGLAHASFAWEKSVWRRVMAVRSEREFGRHVYYGVLVYVSYL